MRKAAEKQVGQEEDIVYINVVKDHSTPSHTLKQEYIAFLTQHKIVLCKSNNTSIPLSVK